MTSKYQGPIRNMDAKHTSSSGGGVFRGVCRSLATLFASGLPSCAHDTMLYRWPDPNSELERAFQFSDADVWRIKDAGELELSARSVYEPAFRSPLGIALIGDRLFGDFVLEVECQLTSRDEPHRDLCLFFGLENANRFYYVHLAPRANPNAHGIFRVADADRINIAAKTTGGIEWGTAAWHRVKLERQLANGSIRVFFDDMVTPIMEAIDTTLGWGMIGVGSFDHTGKFKNISIRGPEVRPTTEIIFPGTSPPSR